jgi:hypothetical protein
MSNWRTGLSRITNQTANEIYLWWPENPRYSYRLAPGVQYPPGGNMMTDGPIYPWCTGSYEINSRAFRIHRGGDTNGPLFLRVFQRYEDRLIYYIAGGGYYTGDRVWAGEDPVSWAELIITANETVVVREFDTTVYGGFRLTPPTPTVPGEQEFDVERDAVSQPAP